MKKTNCVAPLLLLIAITSGCSTMTYSSGSLPLEFRVPPSEQTAAIDLTRLSTPSESSKIIGPGDLLSVTVATDYEQRSSATYPVRISETGVADIHLVGNIALAGLEPTQAEQAIAAASIERGVFSKPRVTVMITRKYTNRVTVVGAVEEPGVVELDRSSSDLLGALARAGGLTESAGVEVQIMRKGAAGQVASLTSGASSVQQASHAQSLGDAPSPQPTTQRINLAQAAQNGLGDFRLQDGDVVMVYEEEPRYVHVMGLVRTPKQIRIPTNHDIRILSAIAMSGGRTMQIADKVQVIRHVPGQPQPILIEASIREATRNGDANLLLAPDDVVTVVETPTTFILGTLQQFIRVGISGTTPLF